MSDASLAEFTIGPILERVNTAQAVAERLKAKPTFVHVFTDRPDLNFHLEDFLSYLQTTLGEKFSIINEGDVWKKLTQKDDSNMDQIATSLARAKRWAGVRQGYSSVPLTLDQKKALEIESLSQTDQSAREFAIGQKVDSVGPRGRTKSIILNNEYYEISSLRRVFGELLPAELINETDERREISLIITGRGIADDEFGRLHMRAGFSSGSLAVVSTTGIVDAPALPLEVQAAEQTRQALGTLMIQTDNQLRLDQFIKLTQYENTAPRDALTMVYSDQMLQVGDKRLTEAMKGITLQMLISACGEISSAQCSTSDLALGRPDGSRICRMHDAHWQQEVIKTQIHQNGEPEFCDFHTRVFAGLKNN